MQVSDTMNHVRGIVIWKNRAWELATCAPLLVFNMQEWARTLRADDQDTVKDCLAAGEDTSIFQAAVAQMDRWIAGEKGLVTYCPEFAIRQTMSPDVIGAREWDIYISKLFEDGTVREIVAGGLPPSDPQFLLCADEPNKFFYGLWTIRVAIRHTGKFVDGQVVDATRLQELWDKEWALISEI